MAAMALLAACARTLSAQDGPPGLSIDGAIGAGRGGRGGDRVERGLIAADLLVAMRVAGDASRGFLVGVEAGRDWQLNGDLLCLAAPGGGCLPQYPGFGALNMVGGYQWRLLPDLRVSVLGGPGYYTAHFDHNSTTTNSRGVGARTDAALQLYGGLSATVVARGAWIPHVRGQSFVPGAVLIGLRLEPGG